VIGIDPFHDFLELLRRLEIRWGDANFPFEKSTGVEGMTTGSGARMSTANGGINGEQG